MKPWQIYFRLLPYCFDFEHAVKTAKQSSEQRQGYYLIAYSSALPLGIVDNLAKLDLKALISLQAQYVIGIGEVAFWPGFGTDQAQGIQALQDKFGTHLTGLYQNADIDLLFASEMSIADNQSQVQGKSIDAIARINRFQQLLQSISIIPELCFAFELALMDIISQSQQQGLGLYLWQLLGHDQHQHYQSLPIKTHALVSNLEQALVACRAGYEALKFKIGINHWAEDLLKIASIRASIPQEIDIKLDANQAFDFENSKGLMICACAFGIHSIEEPLNPKLYAQAEDFFRDLQALAVVQLLPQSHRYSRYLMKDFDTQIAVDESLHQFPIDQIPEEIGIFVIKPMFLGGLIRSWQIAQKAYAQGKQICLTHAMDSSIGRYACAYLCEALINDGVKLHAGLSGAELKDGIKKLSIQNGYLELPALLCLDIPSIEG